MWVCVYLYVKVNLKFFAVFHRFEAFIALKERKMLLSTLSYTV